MMVTRIALMARTKYFVNVLPNNSSAKCLKNVSMLGICVTVWTTVMMEAMNRTVVRY